MISRLYKVSRDKDTNTMATDLASLISNTQTYKRHLVEVKEFYADQPNPYMTLHEEEELPKVKELETFFFLGHTDNRTFGGFSVEEFAAHFDQPFEAEKPSFIHGKKKPFKYSDKAAVQDIYIFGCEAGLANKGKNDSYAQHLANELRRRGFSQVKVHAIAYEKETPGESMIVEVIWKDSPLDRSTKQGFISAHSLDENTVLDLFRLRHLKEHAKEERTKPEVDRQIQHKYEVAKARRKPLANALPPLDFLQRAENTYLGNEGYAKRKKRISQDPGYQDRMKREQILEHVKKIKDEQQELPKKKIFISLVTALETNFALTCEAICKAHKDEYKNLITVTVFGISRTPESKTLSFLEEICKGKYFPEPSTALDLEESESEELDEEKPLLNASPRRSAQTGPTYRPNLFSAAGGGGGTEPVSTKVPENLRLEIEALHESLENEISLLQDRMERACWGLFLAYEINTKAQKRDCLMELKNIKTLAELQAKAKQALEEGRITRGFRNTCTNEWRKSRTRDLLNDIINNPYKTERSSQVQLVNR